MLWEEEALERTHKSLVINFVVFSSYTFIK